ncbi:hypothetical protein BDB01DRAFT_833911 [Pilobolus umbonatus]|nr:hypothetical protein BDB01DRAFT_833911 [Pilobolus umbonatus]
MGIASVDDLRQWGIVLDLVVIQRQAIITLFSRDRPISRCKWVGKSLFFLPLPCWVLSIYRNIRREAIRYWLMVTIKILHTVLIICLHPRRFYHTALTPAELSLLHQEADTLTNHMISEGYDLLTDLGCVLEPWTCGYLDIPATDDYKVDPTVYSRLRDDLLCNPLSSASHLILNKYGSWAAQLLERENVFLDSDYYNNHQLQNESTIACWTALDPVNPMNGTVEIGSLHSQDSYQESRVADIPAGSILFMSNRLPHRSTGNASSKFRRAYMPQYSTHPLTAHNPASSSCQYVALAVPCNTSET